MGYGLNKFVGNVDQNLLCSICSSVLEDAVLTPCGHSFCLLCLETWLARPVCITSCPECRSPVDSYQARPILSVRNLVSNLSVRCDHHDRGCRVVCKLDTVKNHLEICAFSPVECAGCGTTVNRIQLADHQITCTVIADTLSEEDSAAGPYAHLSPTSSGKVYPNGAGGQNGHFPGQVSELASRVASLELQLKKMKTDLEAADVRNKKLERELNAAKDDLEEKRSILLSNHYVDFDPDYDYGFAPNTVAKLSSLISRFLHRKPTYVDAGRVFNCIKRCYDHYARCGSSNFENDTHMLLATAYASNWFTDVQNLSLHCWLQSIARYHHYVRDLAMHGELINT